MSDTRKTASLRLLVAVILMVPALTRAESSRQDDLVTVRDSKFIVEEYSLCEFHRPSGFGPTPKFQMRTYSEAPAEDVISRDNFVAYTATTLTVLRLGMVSRLGLSLSQAFNALDCNEIPAPIGTVDLEVRITITADGMQVEFVDNSTGQVTRNTSPWA